MVIAVLIAAALSLPRTAPAAEGTGRDTGKDTGKTAHFTVTDRAVTPPLAPFTATEGMLGNGARLGGASGFEPRIFRTRFLAARDARNRIVAPAAAISQYDSWASGAFDGAEVEILRIENGAFRSVRRDRVARGGFQAGGWLPVTGDDRVVPGDRRSFVFSPDMWSRTGAPWYFTVRAVAPDGHVSAPARAVSLVLAPDPRDGDAPDPDNGLVDRAVSGHRTGSLAAPGGLRARQLPGRRIELTWDPVPGAAGYAVYRSDAPPGAQRGYHIDLEGDGPPIRRGDLVILRARFLRIDRARLVTNRMWEALGARRAFALPRVPGWSDAAQDGGWHLVEHGPDTPVEDPGETFLRAELKAGQVLSLGGYNHAGPDQDWYPVLQPGRTYRMEVWLRGHSLQPVRFELTGFYGQGDTPMVPLFSMSPTPEWHRYTTSFTVPKLMEGDTVGQMLLTLTGPGRIDVDNFRIYRADAPFLALLPEDAARLKASGMAALRTHAFVGTKQATYDLAQLTNPAGAANTPGGNTLPQTLGILEGLGMDPWLQIEPHFSRAEWLGLAEYLAAPFDPATQDAADLPWAAKRVAEGHPRPWTDSFRHILLEIGNETWNSLFAPWTFPPMRDAVTGQAYTPGTVYGLYQNYVLGILRDSPYWPRLADKLVPVLGGWAISDYGIDAAAASPGSRILAHAAYIGGWDEGEGPVAPTPQGFSSVLTSAVQGGFASAGRVAEAAHTLSAGRAQPLLTGTYEGGPGYAMNGLNNEKVTPEQSARQEEVMKSAAAGTATLDSFLGRALAGDRVQNFFAYGCGPRWNSHACWQKGGQDYPSWALLSLINREGRGRMLEVDTRSVPRADLPALRRRDPVKGAPMVAAYAIRGAIRGKWRLVLVVLSRLVPKGQKGDGHVAVTIDLPFSRVDHLTLHRLSGDYASTNLTANDARLLSDSLPVPQTLPRFEIPDLPPGEALIYVFDGIGS